MFGDHTVLVVAAHPDDEALGCGGTIARHSEAGNDVHLLFLADGTTSRQGSGAADLGRRNEAAAAAAEILGARPPRYFGGPDNALDSLPLIEVVRAVEAVVLETSPDLIYTHHGADLNIDHRIACQAVLTACRPQPESCVRGIYAFEVQSSTEWSAPVVGPGFRPQRFVDVSRVADKKRRALAAYDEELRAFPHARSLEAIDALLRWRGANAGCSAAEAFEVLREVIR